MRLRRRLVSVLVALTAISTIGGFIPNVGATSNPCTTSTGLTDAFTKEAEALAGARGIVISDTNASGGQASKAYIATDDSGIFVTPTPAQDPTLAPGNYSADFYMAVSDVTNSNNSVTVRVTNSGTGSETGADVTATYAGDDFATNDTLEAKTIYFRSYGGKVHLTVTFLDKVDVEVDKIVFTPVSSIGQEGEDQTHTVGASVADVAASGGNAAKGRYGTDLAGYIANSSAAAINTYDMNNEAIFRVKKGTQAANNLQVAKLQVYESATKIAEKILYGTDFPANTTYYNFVVPYAMTTENDTLAFKVYYTANADVWYDKVSIYPMLITRLCEAESLSHATGAAVTSEAAASGNSSWASTVANSSAAYMVSGPSTTETSGAGDYRTAFRMYTTDKTVTDIIAVLAVTIRKPSGVTTTYKKNLTGTSFAANTTYEWFYIDSHRTEANDAMTYRVWFTDMSTVRVDRIEVLKKKIYTLESEKLGHAAGKLLTDANASNSQAWQAIVGNGVKYMQVGPRESDNTGAVIACFNMKVADRTLATTAVTLDMYNTPPGTGVITSRAVAGTDLATNDTYQVVCISGTAASAMEYRGLYNNLQTVTLDDVVINSNTSM